MEQQASRLHSGLGSCSVMDKEVRHCWGCPRLGWRGRHGDRGETEPHEEKMGVGEGRGGRGGGRDQRDRQERQYSLNLTSSEPGVLLPLRPESEKEGFWEDYNLGHWKKPSGWAWLGGRILLPCPLVATELTFEGTCPLTSQRFKLS